MEMALYHPEEGYYTVESEKIGRRGDFYTSPCVAAFFGEMIGKQLEEMWMILGKGSFTVAEHGAGNGVMCNDILNYLKQNSRLYDVLNYCIIEKSVTLRKIQQCLLPEKVSWIDSINEIP